MKLFISDLHFFHNALNTKMDCRGFEDVTAMNSYMIEQWNKKVKKKDEVFILGDFSFGNYEESTEILTQLKGKKHLLIGNHDRFVTNKNFDTSLFVWIKHYAEIHDNGRKLILSHYPVMCYNGQYRKGKNGDPKTYMLYGHVHDTRDQRLMENFIKITRETSFYNEFADENVTIPCNMLNCFCMYSDYQPLSLDEWIEYYNR